VNSYKITITPFGASALIVQWPNQVSETILDDILNFQKKLSGHFKDNWEFVPAYNSLTLIKRDSQIDFKKLKNKLLAIYKGKGESGNASRYLWKLPVCYDDEFAMDLSFLEGQLQLSKEELIRLHTSHQYTVYGIGFFTRIYVFGRFATSVGNKA